MEYLCHAIRKISRIGTFFIARTVDCSRRLFALDPEILHMGGLRYSEQLYELGFHFFPHQIFGVPTGSREAVSDTVTFLG